jgi:CO/xanthine dehydrogenase Mo-binding subunit
MDTTALLDTQPPATAPQPAVAAAGAASTLGQPIAQVNARAKVLGRAQYAGDLALPGMLHAKVLRSPYPHARILGIETHAARALPGVRAVLTGDDAPAHCWGGGPHKERHILARGIVRFCGEEVAAVAADTEEIARDALDLIHVEYEELPAMLTPEEALDEEAPPLHPGRSHNIAHEIRFERGDVAAAFAQADLVLEERYSTHSQYPGYLEPMASVASVDADGRLVVWTSTQSVFLSRARTASALGRPVSSVRVHQATTGGGFGGKIVEDDNQLVAGLLAVHTGRPVRLVNNRLEDFQACCMSLPEQITLKMGLTKDGLIVAKDVHIVAECGAYAGLSGEVMHVSAMRSDNMHRLANVRSHARLVYTNNPPRGAFRGFGGTQMLFALNSHIDTMARMLGLDPVDVHTRNAIGAGETSVHGWKIGSTGLVECIAQATEAIGWKAKRTSHTRRRGVGMAAAMHVSGNRTIGNWDGSTVVVKLNEDGRATVHSSECDMGQGAMTMLSQIVAHELDIPLAHVHVVPPDTDTSPFCIGTLASRVTISAGNAAILAARQVRDKLLALAATELKVPVDLLEIAAGTVRVAADPSRHLALAALGRQHIWRHGGEGIQERATWDPQTTMHDKDLFGNIAPAYSFAAQAVEVEVDCETGRVTVLDSWVADDCGKALNPIAIHGQTNGATVQAFGWALYEQLHFEGGRLQNGNFADYTMATADAVPMLRGGFVESNDPHGPYGAKGASETAILPGAPAIANAVFDAVGVRIRDLPITPEKVLAGLRALRAQEGNTHA